MELKNRGKSDFEDGVYPSLFDTEAHIIKEYNTSTTYRVFIDKPIGAGTTYRNLISILNNASEMDTVYMHINSPGGEVDVALQIYMAILTTQAHTVVQVDGLAASAATFFLMGADQVLLSPHSHIMIHPASFGVWSDMASAKSDVDFYYNRCLKIVKDVYKGFMSEEEIIDMVENHRDINMDSDEVIERLKNRSEIATSPEEVNLITEESEPVEQKPAKKTTRRKKE